jgi:DNA invertase Pin-like site-specific DNA recombinase
MRKPIPILGSLIKIAMSAYIYIRVSSEEQARDMHGLETQLRTCQDYCVAQGWPVKGVFQDAGVSAWKDITRPGFKAAMNALKHDRHANLIFFDYSRFGRKTLPALIAFDKLDNLGVYAIAAMDPTIDGRTPRGRTKRREELSKAEAFSDEHSENQRLRMKLAVENGIWCGPPPLGFDRILSRSKSEPNIAPFETEAAHVRKSFYLMRDGMLLPVEALRKMTELGLRSKKGNELTLDTFVKMLKNPVYIGKMATKYGVVKGLHTGLIAPEVFEDVQAVLDGRRKRATHYQRNREGLPFRRFLHCPCGAPLTGGFSRSHTGKLYSYYWCIKCHAVKSVPTAEVDQQFLAMLDRIRVSEAFTSEFTHVVREKWSEFADDNSEIAPRLVRKLADLNKTQEELLMKYLKNDPVIARHFETLNQNIEDEVAEVKARLEECEAAKATFDEVLNFSQSMLVDIGKAWELGNVNQKQKVQNILFPDGLNFDPEKGILNPENTCLFNHLENFLSGNSLMVRPERFELPT